jgi:hypothetical protein
MIQYFSNEITTNLKTTVSAFIGLLSPRNHLQPIIIIDATSARQKGRNPGRLQKRRER